MNHGISFSELLAWIASETDRYERWFAHQPESVWMISVGTGRIATLRDLLHHVYSVDVRLAQRIMGQPIATDAEVAVADTPRLFALARLGQSMLTKALYNENDLSVTIAWQTQAGGQIKASKRKVLAHAITHHLRHLAQVATLLRLNGHPTDWPHDLLLSDAIV